jgi:hypothetical protein
LNRCYEGARMAQVFILVSDQTFKEATPCERSQLCRE